jgi:hypothetical protein
MYSLLFRCLAGVALVYFEPMLQPYSGILVEASKFKTHAESGIAGSNRALAGDSHVRIPKARKKDGSYWGSIHGLQIASIAADIRRQHSDVNLRAFVMQFDRKFDCVSPVSAAVVARILDFGRVEKGFPRTFPTRRQDDSQYDVVAISRIHTGNEHTSPLVLILQCYGFSHPKFWQGSFKLCPCPAQTAESCISVENLAIDRESPETHHGAVHYPPFGLRGFPSSFA